MDLARGICVLCKNNTKIIIPPQAEDITALIKDILPNQIDCAKFDEVNDSLKVCPLCLHDIVTIVNLKRNIEEEYSDDDDNCILCHKGTGLVFITEWAYFYKILENVKSEKRFTECCTCLDCIKCMDLLEKIRINLLKRYPHLELFDSGKGKKTYESEKVKSSPAVTRNRESPKKANNYLPSNVDNFKAALKHLKPLKNSPFKTDMFKHDKKLWRQVAFVKLSVSNLATKTNKKLNVTSRREKLKKPDNFSDTDSSRDTPSPKQSFFKIRLKSNPTKIKTQRVASGKVSKPKFQKNELILENKKELIIKILNVSLDKLAEEFYQEQTNQVEMRTPTKASRKMMPEDPVSSNKKRKSVSFAEVLDTEITENSTHKYNSSDTPLKSLLKKSVSPMTDLLKNGNDGTGDESDRESNKKRGVSELNEDSDEEVAGAKGYVDDILKNNDDIFNSLKTSENDEVTPAERIKITDSYDNDIHSINSDNGDNEKIGNKKEQVNKNEEQMENNIESLEEEKEDINSENINNKTDSKKQRKEMNKSKEPLEIEKQRCEISSTANSEIVLCNEERENSLSKADEEIIKTAEDPLDITSETSLDDPLIPLEDFKNRKSEDMSDPHTEKNSENTFNENTSTNLTDRLEQNDDQVSEKPIEGNSENVDSDVSNKETIGNNENADKRNSDVDLDLVNSSKNSTPDSNNLKIKSRKRRKSVIEGEEEEKEHSKKSKDDEDFEEPETKNETVSGTDGGNSPDLENDMDLSEKNNEDKPIQVTEEPEPTNIVDDKVDELIVKYTNPGGPNLNNDNIFSDSRNACSNDMESRAEVSSGELEAVNRDLSNKDVVVETSIDNITSSVEKSIEDDITIDSDVIDSDNVTLKEKELDFDNILENVVDSC